MEVYSCIILYWNQKKNNWQDKFYFVITFDIFDHVKL
jgi:hypothetical protein